MERYLIYKRNGLIDKSVDFIHESCFGSEDDEEILLQFHKEGFEAEIVDQETFFNLVNTETEEEEITRLKNAAISSRKNYLTNTDWYVIRETDEPNSYPIEIKNKRTQAREEINSIQTATTLEDIQSFNSDFS